MGSRILVLVAVAAMVLSGQGNAETDMESWRAQQGFVRVDPARWGNIYVRDGKLFYMDVKGVPQPIFMESRNGETSYLFGPTHQFFYYVHDQIVEMYETKKAEREGASTGAVSGGTHSGSVHSGRPSAGAKKPKDLPGGKVFVAGRCGYGIKRADFARGQEFPAFCYGTREMVGGYEPSEYGADLLLDPVNSNPSCLKQMEKSEGRNDVLRTSYWGQDCLLGGDLNDDGSLIVKSCVVGHKGRTYDVKHYERLPVTYLRGSSYESYPGTGVWRSNPDIVYGGGTRERGKTKVPELTAQETSWLGLDRNVFQTAFYGRARKHHQVNFQHIVWSGPIVAGYGRWKAEYKEAKKYCNDHGAELASDWEISSELFEYRKTKDELVSVWRPGYVSCIYFVPNKPVEIKR